MGGLECKFVLGQTLAEEECEAESSLGEGLAEVGMRNLERHLFYPFPRSLRPSPPAPQSARLLHLLRHYQGFRHSLPPVLI